MGKLWVLVAVEYRTAIVVFWGVFQGDRFAATGDYNFQYSKKIKICNKKGRGIFFFFLEKCIVKISENHGFSFYVFHQGRRSRVIQNHTSGDDFVFLLRKLHILGYPLRLVPGIIAQNILKLATLQFPLLFPRHI
jgi:hypothetical protein